MKALFSALGAITALLLASQTTAQTASANGNSGTSCTQTGTSLVCTTTTTLTLPAGTNLAGMTLPQSSATGPACTSLSAAPSLLDDSVATPVTLTVNGCPTSGTYTYSWGAPITSVNAPSTTYTATLSANTPSKSLSVQVCFANNPTACNTYTTTIDVRAPIPALAGCSVSPATSSVAVGSTPALTVTCSAGTGAGSGVSYQWSKNGNAIPGAIAATYTLAAATDTAAAGNSTYSVQVSNVKPSSASASSTVTVTPSVIVLDGCPGTSPKLTILASETYKKIYTSDYGSFAANTDFVIAFNVAAGDSTAGRFLATLGFVDFGASRGGRLVTFSKNKCDYTDDAQWVSPNYFGTKTPVNAGTASVVLGPDTRSADVRLTPGTWYLNMRNVVGFCPSNVSCHAAVEWAN
jgi:hypothetical protein